MRKVLMVCGLSLMITSSVSAAPDPVCTALGLTSSQLGGIMGAGNNAAVAAAQALPSVGSKITGAYITHSASTDLTLLSSSTSGSTVTCVYGEAGKDVDILRIDTPSIPTR